MRTLSEHNQDVIARSDQREPDDYDDIPTDVDQIFALLDNLVLTPPTETNDDEQRTDGPEFGFTQFDALTPQDLVRALEQWQVRKERLEAIGKSINKVFDFLRITKIPASFEEEGIELLAVEGIGRCSLTSDMHVSIAAGRKDDVFTWLRDTGRGDLIAETVNASTLKAVIKKATLAAEQLPEGILNVSPFTRASITHPGGKGK